MGAVGAGGTSVVQAAARDCFEDEALRNRRFPRGISLLPPEDAERPRREPKTASDFFLVRGVGWISTRAGQSFA